MEGLLSLLIWLYWTLCIAAISATLSPLPVPESFK